MPINRNIKSALQSLRHVGVTDIVRGIMVFLKPNLIFQKKTLYSFLRDLQETDPDTIGCEFDEMNAYIRSLSCVGQDVLCVDTATQKQAHELLRQKGVLPVHESSLRILANEFSAASFKQTRATRSHKINTPS